MSQSSLRDSMMLSLCLPHNWFVMTGQWCGNIGFVYSLALRSLIQLQCGLQSWPLHSMHVLASHLVLSDKNKRWRLDCNVLVELHNALLISHVRCRGAYLLRLLDILDICSRISDVFFFHGGSYVRGLLRRWKLKPPRSCANRGKREAYLSLCSPLFIVWQQHKRCKK